MNTLLRLLPCLGVLAAALAGLSLFAPESVAPGRNPLELPGLLVYLELEYYRGEQLADRAAAITERIRQKAIVTGDVIAGRLTLREAAARFADLETNLPHFNWDAYREYFPGRNDAERHCREVIHHARVELSEEPGRDAVVGRLEAELEQLLKEPAE